MIIELLMNLIYTVFEFLTTPIDIPDLPFSFSTTLDTAFEYIYSGIGILTNYTHYQYLISLFMIIVAVEVGIHLYQFVMFILKKIPMINIK